MVHIRPVDVMDFFTLMNDVDWCELPRERDSIYLLAVTHQAPFTVLAEVQGKPVGVLVGNVAVDRSRAYVQHLAVTPAYQRQGIGRRLLERFEETCRQWGVPQVWLLAVVPIYAATGYQESTDYFPPQVMKYISDVKRRKVWVKNIPIEFESKESNKSPA